MFRLFEQILTRWGDSFEDYSWSLLIPVCMIAGVGFAMLYSASGMDWDPWASRQAARFAVSLFIALCVALTPISVWIRYAYVFYGLGVAALLAVAVAGEIGMGARRWIDLGIIQMQPSELMKIAIVIALARYFNDCKPEEIVKLRSLFVPLVMIGIPVLMIARQPDLGTAVFLLMLGGALCFMAGVRLYVFIAATVSVLVSLPIVWQFLHEYQRLRIMTFLDPERDPLGAGFHILQSKIALGSGGLLGKGFGKGTQSHLNFLPEKQTDFIFTMLGEELGLVGALLVICLFVVLLIYGYVIAANARGVFARLVAIGLTVNLFLYVFVNIGMVSALLPVVGVPLPLISYGGTAMMTVMVGFGLLINISIHREDPEPEIPGARSRLNTIVSLMKDDSPTF